MTPMTVGRAGHDPRTPRRARSFCNEWLHTTVNGSGFGDIVDQYGVPVPLAGVNENDMDMGTSQSENVVDMFSQKWVKPDPAVFAILRKEGFNHIRLALSWYILETTAPTPDGSGGWNHTWNTEYLTAIDTVISQAKAAGLAVILDLHQSLWSAHHHYVQKGSSTLQQAEAGPPPWLTPTAMLRFRAPSGDPNRGASKQIYGQYDLWDKKIGTVGDAVAALDSSLIGAYIGTKKGGGVITGLGNDPANPDKATQQALISDGWKNGNGQLVQPPNGDPWVISIDYRQSKAWFIANTPEPGVGTVPLPHDAMAAAYKMLAARYASEPACAGFDIFNEPNIQSKVLVANLNANLHVLYDTVLTAIRSVNTNCLVFVQDNDFTSWNNNSHQQSLGAKPTDPTANKLVYSAHAYPANLSVMSPWLTAALSRAVTWGLPFYIGEIDCFEAMRNPAVAPSNAAWRADTISMMQTFMANYVHFAAWESSGSISYLLPGTLTPKPWIREVLRLFM